MIWTFGARKLWDPKDRNTIEKNLPPLTFLENGTFQPKSVSLGKIIGETDVIEKFFQELGRTVKILNVENSQLNDLKDFESLVEIHLDRMDALENFKNIPKILKRIKLDRADVMVKAEILELLKKIPNLESIKVKIVAVNSWETENVGNLMKFVDLEEEIMEMFSYLRGSHSYFGNEMEFLPKSQVNFLRIGKFRRDQIASFKNYYFSKRGRLMPAKVLEMYCSILKVTFFTLLTLRVFSFVTPY